MSQGSSSQAPMGNAYTPSAGSTTGSGNQMGGTQSGKPGGPGGQSMQPTSNPYGGMGNMNLQPTWAQPMPQQNQQPQPIHCWRSWPPVKHTG